MSISTEKISVIIPCYNNQSTIIETINSVLNQTYSNIEIIVIDDGSTQDIHSSIKLFLQNPNFNFYKQPNKGVSSARNKGASIAIGKYLLFLDADDLIETTYIEKAIIEIEKNPEIKLVYPKCRFIGRKNESWILPNYDNFKKFLIGNCIIISSIIRKKDFDKANGFDENLTFYEDWDLWISILKNGGEVKQIDEELFFYRLREDFSSATDIQTSNMHADNRLKVYLKHYDLYTDYFGNFEHIFLHHIKEIESQKTIENLNGKINRFKKTNWYKFYKLLSKKDRLQ